MTVRLTVPTLDGLPEQVAALYQPAEGGGFRLALDDADDASANDRLVRALRSERDGRKAEAAHARAAEALAADATAKLERERAAAAALRARMLDVSVTEAARAAGLHDAAIADAQRACREAFTVADDGTVTVRDGGGRCSTVADWLTGQREVASHWFRATGSGGGATQSTHSGGSDPSTITRASYEKLSPQMKAAAMHSGVRVTD